LISSGNYFCPDFIYLTAELSITELPPLQTKGLKTKIKNNTSIKTQQDFVKKTQQILFRPDYFMIKKILNCINSISTSSYKMNHIISSNIYK
jgi:hypothetical protein